MSELSYPPLLNVAEELERIPRNIRRSKIVRLARGLNAPDRQALIADLCHPTKPANLVPLSPAGPSSAGATTTAAASTTSTLETSGKDLAALKRVIQAKEDEEEQVDPTTSYYLQELGVLAAAATNEKHELLRLARDKSNELVWEKAVALAVHSSTAVSDQDLRELFNALGERDKKKLVRACACDKNRAELATECILEWISNETETERKLVACELLHAVKPGTKWLPSILREIISLARIAKQEKKDDKKSLPVACYAALRWELLWKEHGETVLIAMLEQDLAAQANGGVLDLAKVFDFYSDALQVEHWRSVGKKSMPKKHSSNVASFVPWRKVFDLYMANLPFEPVNSKIAEQFVWYKSGAVPPPAAQQVPESELAEFQDLLQLTSQSRNLGDKLRLVMPSWLFSKPMLCKVDSGDLLQAYLNLTSSRSGEGVIPTPLFALCTKLLECSLENIPTGEGFSPRVFALVLQVVRQTLRGGCMNKQLFYFGLLAPEAYPSAEAREGVEEQIKTREFIFDHYLLPNLFKHAKITTGQQLVVFTELQSFARTELRLSKQDFASAPGSFQWNSPLQAKEFITKYERFLEGYTRSVLQSISGRSKRAADAGKIAAVQALDVLFAKVVELGMLEIQSDVEAVYLELASRFPIVFARAPSGKIPLVYMVELAACSSSQREFEVQSDEPGRIMNRLFMERVLPQAIAETSNPLVDLGPNHQFAKYASTANVATLARAAESMELVRMEWLDRMRAVWPQFASGTISLDTTLALLAYLEEWAEIAHAAVERASKSRRDNLLNKANAKNTKRNDFPTSCPNAQESLELIAKFAYDVAESRSEKYREAEWKGDTARLGDLAQLIQRALRLWVSATTRSKLDPDLLRGNVLNPRDSFTKKVFIFMFQKVPRDVRQPFLPILHRIFELLVLGQVQHAVGHVVMDAAATERNKQPWLEASEFFTRLFVNSVASDDGGAHSLLVHLERSNGNQSSINAFLKTLEDFLDIRVAGVRKRLEQDLSRSLFPDRFAAMQLLLKCSLRSKSLGEITKTLVRIAKAIENETHENRTTVLNLVLTTLGSQLVALVMPNAQGLGSAMDRAFVLYSQAPPTSEELPSLLEASTRLPQVLFKLLDDLLQSTDEKTTYNFAPFRSLSDVLFRRALTWPCTVLHLPAVEEIQLAWFDCAMELQFKISSYRGGQVLIKTDFRAVLSTGTQTAVRQFILEAGFQPDVPYPTMGGGDARLRVAEDAYVLEANARRKRCAQHVVSLFQQAYARRNMDIFPSANTPLARKPAMERKHMLDLLAMVQGEWIHCAAFAARVEGVADQVASSGDGASKIHHAHLAAIMKALCETCVSWSERCQGARPPWARSSKSDSSRKLFLHPLPIKIGDEMVDEEVVWCRTRFFDLLPSVIPRYWKLCVEQFGIHHPQGLRLGRCLLRMHLRHELRMERGAHRAVRQQARVETALSLLRICPSAVHLRLCQAVLRDFRQDLLHEYVFARGTDDAILGKFHPASQEVEEDDSMELENTSVVGGDDGAARSFGDVFRLHGFYGFEQLTYLQGRALARIFVSDLENENWPTTARVAAVSRLRFLPCVGHADFAQVLTRHYENKTAYLAALKTRRSMMAAETTTPTLLPPLPPLPLPENLVEVTFHAILQDGNPLSLVALLDTRMMQKSSTRITVRVAERMRVLLPPNKVLALIQILLHRTSRDALLVGPLKAFLRILFAYALESERVVGKRVILGAAQACTAQWARKDLHPDARIVLVVQALRALAKSSDTFEFAWNMLEDVSKREDLPNKLRALFSVCQSSTCAFPSKALNLSRSKEYTELCKEVRATMGDGALVVPAKHEARFLTLLLAAREACQRALLSTTLALDNLGKKELRRRGALISMARNAAITRALLTVDLLCWVQQSEEDTFRVFDELEQAVSSAITNAEAIYADEAQRLIYSQTIPERMGELASAVYSQVNTQTVLGCEERMLRRACEVNRDWFAKLQSLGFDQNFARLRCVTALKFFSQALSGANSASFSKQSLFVRAFAKPFAVEIDQLRREHEVSTILYSFLPNNTMALVKDGNE